MWMFSLYLVCCMALARASPFQQLSSSRISGKDVDITEVPYHGSLELNGNHLCSVAIISNEFVITGGQCGDETVTSELKVRVGSNWLQKDGSVHNVQKFIRHEYYNFNSSSSNDIALIKVDPAIIFDSTRQPVGMFNHNEITPPKIHANFTGWNSTYLKYDIGIRLQILTVPIFAKKICQEVYAPAVLSKDQICAGYFEGGKNNCRVDVGGPLTIGGRLTGIASWGAGCGGLNSPDVYTEVAWHRDWIRRHANV